MPHSKPEIDGLREVPQYNPTGHELQILAKSWAEDLIKASFYYLAGIYDGQQINLLGLTRAKIYACERLRLLVTVLGAQYIRETIENALQKFKSDDYHPAADLDKDFTETITAVIDGLTANPR